MRRKLLVIATFLLGVVALCACSAPPSAQEVSPYTVRVVATRNFGQELVFDRLVEITEGTPAMEALKQVAQVETSYGGGFVSSINGICSEYAPGSSLKQDWFFYINGIMSNVGALDYILHRGDMEHWDFHSWSFHTFIPAIIGAFPETFQSGFGGKASPTLIVFSDNLRQVAQDLESQLARMGVNSVGLRGSSELRQSEKETSNLILLGTVDENLVSELNRNWRRLGFFAYIEGGSIVILNARGEAAARYGTGVGLIQATQNPWNPKGVGSGESVVWMVTGTDETGVREAASALISRRPELRYAYAAVVINGQIVKVPQ